MSVLLSLLTHRPILAHISPIFNYVLRLAVPRISSIINRYRFVGHWSIAWELRSHRTEVLLNLDLLIGGPFYVLVHSEPLVRLIPDTLLLLGHTSISTLRLLTWSAEQTR